MKMVTLAEAKAKLSAVVDEVEAGASIAISRRHRIVAILSPAAPKRREKSRPAALAKGLFAVPADFDAPLPDDEVERFEGR